MESVQSTQEAPQVNGMAELQDIISKLSVSRESNTPTKSRLEQAKDLAIEVAANAKKLDQSVDQVGKFFESILEDELLEDQINQKLIDQGYQETKDRTLGIPNALDEQSFDRFDLATHTVITAQESELRKQAMFLVSFCNQLMFERGLLDSALNTERENRRKLLVEYLKGSRGRAVRGLIFPRQVV